jgi:hypothetical protein
MTGIVISFIAGLLVMDLFWAFKLGLIQQVYYRWRHRNDPVSQYEHDWEDPGL